MKKRFCISCKYIGVTQTYPIGVKCCNHPANVRYSIYEDYYNRRIILEGFMLKPEELNNDNLCKFYKGDWKYFVAQFLDKLYTGKK